MFDIKLIRDNPAAFDAGLKKRGLAPLAGALIAIDEARRKVVTRLQVVQARRNAASKEIGKAKAVRDDAAAAKLVAEVAALKDELQTGEQKQGELEQQLQAALSVIPNIPRDDVPAGFDAKDNIQVRSVGDPPRLAVDSARQHFEIGEGLQLMDFATAAKLSGARFVVLKGALARLERALGAFMLDLHTTMFGYTEVSPPLLVKDASAYGTGNLPKFADDLFAVVKDTARLEECLKRAKQLSDGELASKERAELSAAIEQGIEMATQGRLWLLPTAEVALTNFVREQIVDEGELPLRLTAYTPCFRSEAGAAGKDTRGMIRQHQFSKVELVSITTPEQSTAEHERMTECAETVLKRLGLAYRTMLLCSGDLGFASQKTYDIEVWLPGQDTYREISSCSLCGDFQARRMHARFRPKGGKDTRFPHTLNGSGLAIGRTLVAILENYQQADGSVLIPEALLPYMGGMKRIEKA